MCVLCYEKLDADDKKCPICRVSMRDPHRNRIAENHVKNMVVCCEESGCNQKIKYSEIYKHLDYECQYVLEKCRYALLGCNWEGPRRLQNDHKHNNMSFDNILEKMNDLDEWNEELIEKINDAKWENVELDSQLNRCNLIQEELKVKLNAANAANKKANEENTFFCKYHNIITQSDVYEEFDLVHIWNDFGLKNHGEDADIPLQHSIALRFTGNHNRSYKLTLWFRPYQRSLIHSDINIECRVSIKCETRCENRYFQVLVLPSVYKTNRLVNGISVTNYCDTFQIQYPSDVNTFYNYEGKCIKEWLSDWRNIFTINADSLKQANEIMNKYGRGVIKVFAYHHSRHSV